MKISNSGAPSSNFSLKCVKTLQKCIKDLKKGIRLMQFESQRIQKHTTQQILNFSINLLTALTTCNLYRINFQEEVYYLTQLQKIEKGINEIVEFVQQLSNRKYFTSISNNQINEDLFIQLESTFDSFVGPLLHIFNNINVNWLLFQCEPLKLYLLDEFNSSLICQKLGLSSSDEMSEKYDTSNREQNNDNNSVHNVQETQNNNEDQNNKQINKIEMNNINGSLQSLVLQNNVSIKIVQQNQNESKILDLKKKYNENHISKKQFVTDLINLYKSIIPQNTCLCELAILIDLMSDQNPQFYYKIFLEYYIQLFDFNTSEKISYVLKQTTNFETLNKYTRLIFYNMDIMNLPLNKIIKFIKPSSNQKYKDLHIQLVRSGYNSLPIPITTSPLKHEKKSGFSLKNPPQLHFQFNLQKSQGSQRLIQKQINPKFSSSNFCVGSEIVMCPHSSNFFSLTPILNDIYSDNKIQNLEHTKSNLQGDIDQNDIKNQNQQIQCNYIQQLIDEKNMEEQMKDEYIIKRSNTISERCCEYIPSIATDDMFSSYKSKQFYADDSIKMPKIDLEIQKSKNQESNQNEEKEQKTNLIMKKEIIFGRRAKNYIIKPDFYFEDLEYTLSRQQFKITYEDQSNEYNIQCMSHSSLTQLLIDEQGFELTPGAVFIIQDQIAFQVIALKQFSELVSPLYKQQTQNNISKSIIKINSTNQSEQQISEQVSHATRIQQYKKRQKSGRLSYKNSQLFEEYDVQQQNEGKTIDFDEKNGVDQEENNKDDSEYSNTLSGGSQESSPLSLQSSASSLSSISQIATNHMQQQFDKRTSIKNKKNQFINQIRQFQSQRGSYRYQTSSCQQSDTQVESPIAYQTTSIEQSPLPVTPHSMINKQILKIQAVDQDNSLTEPNQSHQTNNTTYLNSGNEFDEVTQDFKKQTTFNICETQTQQQSSTGIQQSVQFNGMNVSSQKFMMQSTMNQSVLSIAGNSLYEIEDDPYKDDAILHIRVLWSNIEIEKEDYIFQYNSQTDRDSIIINFGSGKQNQVRIQDTNNLIKPEAHCTIVCQDNAWTIVSQNYDSNYYSGLALKQIEEIESGLVSKKILLESGFNILVQGYIFSCNI